MNAVGWFLFIALIGAPALGLLGGALIGMVKVFREELKKARNERDC